MRLGDNWPMAIVSQMDPCLCNLSKTVDDWWRKCKWRHVSFWRTNWVMGHHNQPTKWVSNTEVLSHVQSDHRSPGLKGSTKTSAVWHSLATTSWPFFCFTSTWIDFFPRARQSIDWRMRVWKLERLCGYQFVPNRGLWPHILLVGFTKM